MTNQRARADGGLAVGIDMSLGANLTWAQSNPTIKAVKFITIQPNSAVSGGLLNISGTMTGHSKQLFFLTGNYTLIQNDSGKVLHFQTDVSSSLFVANTLSGGFTVDIVQRGPNQIAFSSTDPGVSFRNFGGFTKTQGPDAVATLIHSTGNVYFLYGQVGA